jgi:hypothetical protein
MLCSIFPFLTTTSLVCPGWIHSRRFVVLAFFSETHFNTRLQLSTASAALDLAPLSQTPPRSIVMGRAVENGIKSSEWPQFPDSMGFRDRRVATNPNVGASRGIPGSTNIMGHNATSGLVAPLTSESRRPTPPVLADNGIGAIRSVPATPLGIAPGGRPEGGTKTAGILTPGGIGQSKGLGHFGGLDVNTPSDRSGSLSRMSSGLETPLTFSSIHTTDDSLQVSLGGLLISGTHEYNVSAWCRPTLWTRRRS